MMYAEYSYYVSEFGGNIVPETDWQMAATKASRFIDQLTGYRAATMADSDAVKLATCAAAEVSYKYNQYDKKSVSTAGVSSESVGSYSVSYANTTAETLEIRNAEMTNAAAPYLLTTGLLYKGVYCGYKCDCNNLPSIN